MPKLVTGELARTTAGQTVTVLGNVRDRVLVQFANNRRGYVPGTDLTPLGPKPASRAVPGSRFKIPVDLKAAAMAKANRNGETLTAVVIDLLTAYVQGTARPLHDAQAPLD